MKYKTKILRYQNQQRAYLEYLADPVEFASLSLAQKVHICNEVNRLNLVIEALRAMPVWRSELTCTTLDVVYTSKLIRPLAIKKRKATRNLP